MFPSVMPNPNKYLIFVFIFFIFACGKNGDNGDVTKTMEIPVSSSGTIINSSPREIVDYFQGSQGNELRIGWNNDGYAMRSFLSFSVSQILPSSDKELIINSAILKVYESNTLLFPFVGDGGSRNVLVSLMDYEDLDESDYDAPVFALCGIIAADGYDALKEYSLDITDAVYNHYLAMPSNTDYFRFRLQFNSDNNIPDLENSELDGSMWNIFSKEGDSEYVPVLEIDYTHKAR
jgi:hypothetical protein